MKNQLSMLASVALFVLVSTGSAMAAPIPGLVCNGCSEGQMSSKAAQATGHGEAFVFNRDQKVVRKYFVFTEIIDTIPYTSWTTVFPRTVDQELSDSFTGFVNAMDELQTMGAVVLPPDFPISTVAGALEDNSAFEIALDSALNSGSIMSRPDRLSRFVEELAQNLIGQLDFGELQEVNTLKVVFSDGSSIEVRLEIHDNGVDPDRWATETLPNSARLPDGSTAPNTGGWSWINFSYQGTPSQVLEWLAWARANGIPIVNEGSGSGGGFTCSSNPNGEPFCEEKQPE